MAFDMTGYKKLTYRNHASTDFGILLSYPWVPVHATRDVTATHVPGVSGDVLQDDGSYQNVVETFTGIVIRDPRLYSNWYDLDEAVNDWLRGGNYSYLRFDGYPDWAFEAIAQPHTITPDPIDERKATISLPFNCKPIMYRIDGIEWQTCPIGTVTNTSDSITRPDFHIIGTGNFFLRINGLDYQFYNVDGDVYLDGESGNAFCYDSQGVVTSKNPDVEFPYLDSPELMVGANTIYYANSATITPTQPTETAENTAPASTSPSNFNDDTWQDTPPTPGSTRQDQSSIPTDIGGTSQSNDLSNIYQDVSSDTNTYDPNAPAPTVKWRPKWRRVI